MFFVKRKAPFILVVSGVSGAGKGSVLSVLKEKPDQFLYSISYTTRPMRQGEVDGKDYNFISNEEFEKAVAKGEFLEWEPVHAFKYGTKKKDLFQILNSGKIPVLELDVKGLINVKKKFKNALSVMIVPPSLEEAEKRLKARGTESEAEIAKRISRYPMEMAQAEHYDYVLTNDNLEKAKGTLLSIIQKEKEKRRRKKLSLFVGSLVLLLGLALLSRTNFAQALWSQFLNKSAATPIAENPPAPAAEEAKPEATPVANSEQPAKEEPKPAAKKKIAANPPKAEEPKKEAIVEQTKTNTDGSQTTVVSTGSGVAPQDYARLDTPSTTSTALNLKVTDETGLYSTLSDTLRNYLNSTLKWRNEISSLSEIVIRDAGATGWTGQYLGQYTMSADGSRITSENGMILLNTFYYKADPNFVDYMKLTLSHEYGHHYTLYHKWIDWNLPIGSRFPDAYYTMRPLSKSTTAIDYSLGWQDSEPEIIAEDYSYFYSGYGVQRMNAIYGYPTAATKSWLDTIGESPAAAPAPVVQNQAPLISITAPIASASLSGLFDFKAEASDDIAVQKVSFYLNGSLLGEDSAAPYEVSVDSTKYKNDQYELKVVATDGSLTKEQLQTVTFNNPISLTVLSPAVDPYLMTGSQITLQLSVYSGANLDKVELFLDENKLTQWLNPVGEEVNSITLDFSLSGIAKGSHIIKLKGYDHAAGTVEKQITVTRDAN